MDVKQILFFGLVFLASCLHTAYAPGPQVRLTLKQIPTAVQTGDNVGLECRVSDKEIDWTEWKLPDGTIASHNCTIIAEGKPYLGLACDTVGQDELFQLNISAVDHVRDDGLYTCIHNGTTETITLDVQVPVTEVNKSENVTVSIDGTQDIMCVTNCAHPEPIIKWAENTNPVTLVPVEEIENCDGTKLSRTRSVLTVPWNENETSSVLECCAGLANNALDTCQQITISYEQLTTTTEPQTTTQDVEQPTTTTDPQTTTQDGDSTTTNEATPPSQSTTTRKVTIDQVTTNPESETPYICTTLPPVPTTTGDATGSPVPTTTDDATGSPVPTTTDDATGSPVPTTTVDATGSPVPTTSVDATQPPSPTVPDNSGTIVAGHLLVNLLVISGYIAFI